MNMHNLRRCFTYLCVYTHTHTLFRSQIRYQISTIELALNPNKKRKRFCKAEYGRKMTSIRGTAWTKAEKKEMWEQIQTCEQNQGHLKPEKWLGESDQHQGESGVGPAVSTVSQNACESKDLLLPTSLFLKVSVLLKCIEFLPWQVPQGLKLNPSSLRRRKSERETSPEGSRSAVPPSAFICRLSDPTVNEGQLGPSQSIARMLQIAELRGTWLRFTTAGLVIILLFPGE